ncbi:MAG: MarR family winged helix-turn-helix transcriptional regulator [Paracoccaceae bacterium]
MSHAPELLELVGTLMRVMLISERTPGDYQHAIPYNALDFNTIGAIRRSPGLRATRLADELGIAPTTASSVIARLVKKGLIERQRDKTDGRAAALFLTRQGQSLADTLHAQDIRNMEFFLSALTPDEQADLLRLLGKVTARVRALEGGERVE